MNFLVLTIDVLTIDCLNLSVNILRIFARDVLNSSAESYFLTILSYIYNAVKVLFYDNINEHITFILDLSDTMLSPLNSFSFIKAEVVCAIQENNIFVLEPLSKIIAPK